jgi:hypothetical protein
MILVVGVIVRSGARRDIERRRAWRHGREPAMTPAPIPPDRGLHAHDISRWCGVDAPPGRATYDHRGMMLAADATTSVEAGALEIVVSVTVTYRAR